MIELVVAIVSIVISFYYIWKLVAKELNIK
jgi:hypothetical protein